MSRLCLIVWKSTSKNKSISDQRVYIEVLLAIFRSQRRTGVGSAALTAWSINRCVRIDQNMVSECSLPPVPNRRPVVQAVGGNCFVTSGPSIRCTHAAVFLSGFEQWF